MSKLKLKNIQQTVISNVTQPLKLGGTQFDASDAKIVIESNGDITFKINPIMPNTEISNANDAVKYGVYTYNTSTLNTPSSAYGIIETQVGASGAWVFQTSTTVDGVIKRRRNTNNAGWSAWV